MTATTEPPPLVLFSDCLCYKGGFSDGDIPEQLLDWADEADEATKDLVYDVEWRPVLCALVRRFLLPALAPHHDVTVRELTTNHNPIRASVVDGQEVFNGDASREWAFTPESVTVSGADVLAVIREMQEAG